MRIKYMLILFIIFFSAQAKITQIHSLAEAQTILDAADDSSLVLFDVDDTLIASCTGIFHPKTAEHEILVQALKNNLKEKTKDAFDLLWSKAYLYAEIMLVENEVADIIKNLQKRNVKVMALTLRDVGVYGFIQSLEEHCFTQLQKCKIDFQHNAYQDIIFNEFEPVKGIHPRLYKGIFLTNGTPKGMVLGSFLNTLSSKPQCVIFFDDIMQNLISVEQEMLKQNIDFHGYHYTRAHDTLVFDFAKAQKQFDFLHQHGTWPNDKQL